MTGTFTIDRGNMLPCGTARVLWSSPAQDEVVCRFAVGGDFFPSDDMMTSAPGGWGELASALGPVFEDLELTFLNLECPVDVGDLEPAPLEGLGSINCAGAGFLDLALLLHVRVAGLANNHIYNFGEEGLERTRAQLEKRGIAAIGAGRTLSEPPEVCIWESAAGVRVGFWAAANITREPAASNRRGVEPATRERARQALSEMDRGSAQCRVALLHAGPMWTHYPDPADVELMDQFLESGFDVVAACHSHRISGHKSRVQARPGFCFYGLGSVLSSYCPSEIEREGLLAVFGLNRRGELRRVEARPLFTVDSGWPASPDPATAETILNRFDCISRQIADASYRDAFYRDTGRNLFGSQLRDVLTAYRSAGLKAVVRKAGRLRVTHLRQAAHKLFR